MRRYAMHIYDLKRNFDNNSSKEDNEPPLPFRERGKKKNEIDIISYLSVKFVYNLIAMISICLIRFFSMVII